MMECRKQFYPFVWENSKLIFDWGSKVLHVEFAESGREYSRDIPLTGFPTHTFYVIAGLIYYGGELPKGQAEYKLAQEKVVFDFIPATKPKKNERALMLLKDDAQLIYTRFYFNTLRLKAFLDMLEALDKVVSVAQIPEGKSRAEITPSPDKEVTLIKSDGEVYIEDVHIPMPDRSALYEVLKRMAKFGDTYLFKSTYDNARVVVVGDTFELFKREGDKFVPWKQLKLKREDALRMMCVLSPLR